VKKSKRVQPGTKAICLHKSGHQLALFSGYHKDQIFKLTTIHFTLGIERFVINYIIEIIVINYIIEIILINDIIKRILIN